ncbi:sulfur carrier protein ThiS [Shewanella algidipiscicola]|uniref:Sulfur carrier protein ThiS n=1 Tax=Shewanella algidipiscicola TaxID=614070 RepID=A0ABQ4PLA0_9GAMM|nr:sulfur carrier protein ThiS [Shewanella algidipiscicola]GIU48560.1 hypothetical protein TUM4630_25180 [Shewanella algidipiscicola]
MDEINLMLNGEPVTVANRTNVQQLLLAQKIQLDRVAVVCGGDVVPKSMWSSTLCEEGNVIEIFGVVAGG